MGIMKNKLQEVLQTYETPSVQLICWTEDAIRTSPDVGEGWPGDDWGQ